MDESLLIKAEKKKTYSEVDLSIICLTKKQTENVIKKPKFYQELTFNFVENT